jgi:hypothetical protein
VGGNKIEYADDTSTPTANLTTAKLVVNSVVSTPDAKFATGDISDFYLFTNMDKCKYMWIPIYVGKQHAQHLFTSLRENYKITEDWTGELYLGIKLKWDYKNRTVDLSMPNYVSEALHKFQHSAPY